MCDVWMGEEEEGCVTKVLLTHEFGPHQRHEALLWKGGGERGRAA